MIQNIQLKGDTHLESTPLAAGVDWALPRIEFLTEISEIEVSRAQARNRRSVQSGLLLMPKESSDQPGSPIPAARAILVVDDDPLVQQALGAMLSLMGMQPVHAFTGEEALAKLAAGLEPDLVILDMDMPGLGGAGTLPRLRALRPVLPVLISTGRMQDAVHRLIREHPAVGLMQKPFDLKDLRNHLAAALPLAPSPEVPKG
jgi:CheY-like chemotaxis protein